MAPKTKNEAKPEPDTNKKGDGKKGPKGHRGRGAGTVMVDKGPKERTLGDGELTLEVKTWQKMPSQLLLEWTQKQKRPKPRYVNAKSWAWKDELPIIRKKVILPDPKVQNPDPKKDLVFTLYESVLEATTDDIAKEEAALLTMYCLGPTLPLERVLPEPFKSIWIATQNGGGNAGGNTAGNDDGATGTGSGTTAKTAKEIREEKQREKEEKKAARKQQAGGGNQDEDDDEKTPTAAVVTCKKPLRRENWYSSVYEREQYELKQTQEKVKTSNAKEVKQDFQASQYTQPLYISQKMRAECLRVLREEGKLGIAGRRDEIIEDSITLEDLEADGISLDGTKASTDEIDVGGENRELLIHFVHKIGFDAEDVSYAIEACKQGGTETVTKDLIQEWLTLNVPEESLPEKFKVKGQFDLQTGGAMSSTASAQSGKAPTAATTSGMYELPSQQRLRQQQDEEAKKTILKHLENFLRSSLKNDLVNIMDSDNYFDGATIDSLMCSVDLFIQQVSEDIDTITDESELEASIGDAHEGCCSILESEGVDREAFLDTTFTEKWTEMVTELKLLKVATTKRKLEEEKRKAEMQKKEKEDAEKAAAPGKGSTEGKTQDINAGGSSANDDDEIEEQIVDSSNNNRSWFSSSRSDSGKKYTASPPLPAQKVRDDFLTMVKSNDVTLIVGQTGCGKSTQLPAFLLQDGNNNSNKIVCTQPRKLAAVSLARRVSQEVSAFSSGASPGSDTSPIGYCVRGDVQIGKNCGLVYCTVGVLLKKLLEGNIDFTHLVIDEAHERSLEIDFLLMLVCHHFSKQKALGANSKVQGFKCIIMSATLDQSIVDRFQNSAAKWTSARLDIPGRTFPVKVAYWGTARDESSGQKGLNYFRIAEAVKSVLNGDFNEKEGKSGGGDSSTKGMTTYSKAILVFVPGVYDINQLKNILMYDYGYHASKILPLHSQLSNHEQKKCFDQIEGKVVISTNVCETSITIPDVTCVIDSCREKRLSLRKSDINTKDHDGGHEPGRTSTASFSTLRLTELTEQDCAKASLEQRRGRAGRVMPGLCLRMITERYFEEKIQDTKPSDMEILPLEDIILQLLVYLKSNYLKSISGGGKNEDALHSILLEVLKLAPSMPEKAAVEAALHELEAVGGIERTSNKKVKAVLPLGQHLARLACGCRVGKLLVYSAVLGVPSEGAALAAMLSTRNPLLRLNFNGPNASEATQFEKTRMVFRRTLLKPGGTKSDHCLLAGILEYLEGKTIQEISDFPRSVKGLATKLKLSADSISDAIQLKKTFLQGLRSLGFKVTNYGKKGGNHGPTPIEQDSHRWHLLRAACVAAFFLVKAKRPLPTYKKLASGGSVELPCNPSDVRYFPLETDETRIAKMELQKQGQKAYGNRFFMPTESVFWCEAPNGCYLTHSSILALNGKLLLEQTSEASPLSVLLLGNFPGDSSTTCRSGNSEIFGPLEFCSDGRIVVDGGKLIYTTTGVVRTRTKNRTKEPWRENHNAESEDSSLVLNPLISILIRKLRFQLQTDILQKKIENPAWDVDTSPLVKVIKKLLGSDGMG